MLQIVIPGEHHQYADKRFWGFLRRQHKKDGSVQNLWFAVNQVATKPQSLKKSPFTLIGFT